MHPRRPHERRHTMPFVSAHERLNRHFAVRAALGATIGEASATRKCLSLRGLLVVRIGWITGNLCDLSKEYFVPTFLSSSLTCPARQSRLCGVFRACRNTCDIPED